LAKARPLHVFAAVEHW